MCVFNSNVIKELLETASHQPRVFKRKGERKSKKTLELEDNQWSSGETSLNKNLNKVIEDLWGEGVSPTESLAFHFLH